MLFQTYGFVLAFLPLCIMGYYLLGHCKKYRLANVYLLFASICFYGLFNWMYVPMIFLSILINYAFAHFIRKEQSSKVYMWIGIVANIGILAFFKYSNFFIENINTIFQQDYTLLNLLIPIGISFFTFQQISFIVDTYKNPKMKYPLLEYALHIMFFAYIISGPIVRHNQIIPQFLDKQKKKFNAENFSKGLLAFTLGLAKKVLIADTFALAANWGYDNVQTLNTTTAILVMLGYTLQIYFDFSGYSDMVTGIGKMLNIDIPMNFNSPYRALSIIDFWKRWHISLTRFFTDYVYIPMGGNRRGKWMTYFNIFLVFFISGIWHGANWTFIVWGIIHGVANMINRLFKKQWDGWHPAFAWLITFAIVNIAWIFFRANSLSDVLHFVKVLVSFQFGAMPVELTNLFVIPEFRFLIACFNISSTFVPAMITGAFYIISMVIILQVKNTKERMDSFKPTTYKACCYAFLLCYCILSFSSVTSFIYVNF